ncbi:MAG: AgmX/PglI C-terminal domain-containing protein [Polyangiaceae bacterium]
MRKALIVGLVVSSLVPFGFACGGGTPPAKGADDEAPASSGGDTASASAAPADSSPAATPSADTAPPASTAASGSGDIKVPTGDDPWMAAHEMPAKDVAKTMRSVDGKVKACFKAGLKRDPGTTGEVKLKFVITNDGVVRAWKDNASSMTDGEVTKCVGDVLNGRKFPKQKSPGDAWGTFSIRFGQ